MKIRWAERWLLISGILILLGTAFPIPSAHAGQRWSFGNNIYLNANTICRDGLRISAGWSPVKDEDDAKTPIVEISARLYTNTMFPPPVKNLGADPEYYGPLLIPPTAITMTDHSDAPIQVDAQGDGFDPNQGDFLVTTYKLDTIIPWTRLLDVGSTIIITGGAAKWAEPVADCYLNRLSLDEGATQTIKRSALYGGDGATAAKNLVYRLATLPAHGALHLSGTPLKVGAFFTQDDIDLNRLQYVHDGGETTSDSFAFSVQSTSRVSVGSTGMQGTGGYSSEPAISSTGRYVAFTSTATNLVVGDDNRVSDIFSHDRRTGATSLVSVATDGTPGNGRSSLPAIAPGKEPAIAFVSSAIDLVNASGNCGVGSDGHADVYTRVGTTTSRRSVTSFRSGTCEQGNASSTVPSLSAGGIKVAFQSSATNLLVKARRSDGNGANDDIFMHSPAFSGSTTLASAAGFNGPWPAHGSSAPSITADGGAVAFVSSAGNLVPGDTAMCKGSNCADVFVSGWGTIVRVSVSSSGTQGNGASSDPAISANGRFVAFVSEASNLVGDDTTLCGAVSCKDIFVRDRDVDGNSKLDEPGGVATTVVSRGAHGQANGSSIAPSISADGRFVAFQSDASNLVTDDTNNRSDIFVHDRTTGSTRRVSVDGRGRQTVGDASINPAISFDGSYIAFESNATNLTIGDTNRERDVFVHHLGFSSRFPIIINPANDTPTIAFLANQTTKPGVAVGPIMLNLGDAETAPGNLQVIARSSNAALVPPTGLVLGGSGAQHTLTIRPAQGQSGITTIIVEVTDGVATGRRQLILTVQ